jgi:phage protein D
MAPKFSIKVAGFDIGDLVPFVDSIEYENVEGMADQFEMRLKNAYFKLSNKKMFQPGNTINFFMGYGNEALEHVGAAIIVRKGGDFPRSGIPVISITGYTKDYQLMENEPEEKQPRLFVEKTYDEIVSEVAGRNPYTFTLDVDVVETGASKIKIQKNGMSDYELIKGIANINGYYLWVDGNDSVPTEWTLHFKNKDYIDDSVSYTFRYNDGNRSTLLSASPEFLIKGGSTKLQVVTRNTLTGALINETIQTDKIPAESEYTGDEAEEIGTELGASDSVKLMINDFSFNVVPSKVFDDAADATRWAQQWFRRIRENAVMLEGETIGVQTLRARQVHRVSGLGIEFDGNYFFDRVKHKFSPSNGYLCDFSARRIIE